MLDRSLDELLFAPVQELRLKVWQATNLISITKTRMNKNGRKDLKFIISMISIEKGLVITKKCL